MTGIMQMVANNVSPFTTSAIPTPTLYLDAESNGNGGSGLVVIKYGS